MSKTVLFVASVTKKHIIQFHLPYMKWFKDHGYKVHVCAGDDFEPEEARHIPYCDEYYIVPFYRSPFATQNFRSYKELRKLIEENEYELVHSTHLWLRLLHVMLSEPQGKSTTQRCFIPLTAFISTRAHLR